jgi:DNA-binding response OmpR family regulator
MMQLETPGGKTIRRIAVLEDDDDIRELIGLYLKRDSMEPVLFASPVTFLAWLDTQKTPPDLLILDLMMPELSGADVIKAVRKRPSCDKMPIVVCSAKAAESDVILTLGLGADTYVRKPFNPHELVAQVSAMLRRAQAGPATSQQRAMTAGPISIDPARKTASVGGKPIDLTPAEYHILTMLIERKGSVVSREDLLRAIGETDAVERVVDVHITSIRHKLSYAAHLLRTSRSFGYYIEDDA